MENDITQTGGTRSIIKQVDDETLAPQVPEDFDERD